MDKEEVIAKIQSTIAERKQKEQEEDSNIKNLEKRIQKRINAAIKRETNSCTIYKHILGDDLSNLKSKGFNIKYLFNPERTEISW